MIEEWFGINDMTDVGGVGDWMSSITVVLELEMYFDGSCSGKISGSSEELQTFIVFGEWIRILDQEGA